MNELSTNGPSTGLTGLLPLPLIPNPTLGCDVTLVNSCALNSDTYTAQTSEGESHVTKVSSSRNNGLIYT